jgi:hypothetical protein
MEDLNGPSVKPHVDPDAERQKRENENLNCLWESCLGAFVFLLVIFTIITIVLVFTHLRLF